ncbi:hypothetical protein [Nostoc sp. MG11]|uniref:hypothetical protein n=1 Tax=Nostoc sp. MG11 TaxID=2721166 RepID=UPI001868F148|nr:hypothetical protein [Nostoc sp. MG11]
MSSGINGEKIASNIALSSSKIALTAFEHHIEKKLNEKTEKQEPERSNSKINLNAPKSF